MRLLERTLVTVAIHHREDVTDGMGSVRQGFASESTQVRGSVLKAGNSLNYAANFLVRTEHGERATRTIHMLLPRDTDMRVSDGVRFPEEDAPGWRCIAVDAWSAHICAKLEKIV